MDFSTALEITGLILGLIYLWWEYHADPRFWLVSMIMPCISMWLYFSKGIYADFAINIYYFVIAIYGYWNWTRKSRELTPKQKDPTPHINRVPLKVLGGCVFATLVLWFVISQVLINFTDSTIPYPDGFTTALSIVALWMGARKYAEQWIAWFIVDLVTVPIQIYKGIPFYSCLYAVYTVIALFGYRKWLKLAREE